MSELQREAYKLVARLDEELERAEESPVEVPASRWAKLRRAIERAEKRFYRRGKV